MPKKNVILPSKKEVDYKARIGELELALAQLTATQQAWHEREKQLEAEKSALLQQYEELRVVSKEKT